MPRTYSMDRLLNPAPSPSWVPRRPMTSAGCAVPVPFRARSTPSRSMAESMVIWRAVMRQTGAIEVDNLEEMVDSIKALLYVPFTRHNRVALISMTGGQSVVTTDAFAKAGLQVPTLSEQSYARLGSFFNIVGGSYRNPIDMGSNWETGEQTSEILEILEDDPQVDIIAVELSLNLLFRRMEANPPFRDFLLDLLTSHKRHTHKPFLALVTPSYVPDAEEEASSAYDHRGDPSFPPFNAQRRHYRAALAINAFWPTSKTGTADARG